MSATALPFQEGMNTVGAPRVMPLLEQRLTRVRRHRVALWMVDTGVVALTALLTVALPVEPRLPRAALVATVLTITVAWATAMLILRYATREGGLGGRFDLLAILHPAAIAVAVVAVVEQVTGWPILPTMLTWTTPTAIGALLIVHAVRYLAGTRNTAPWALAPRTLIVGDASGVESVLAALTGGPPRHNVIGVATSDGSLDDIAVHGRSYRVVGPAADAATLARELGVETVVLAGGVDDGVYLRKLRWSLEGVATDLVIATSLADVSRARIAFQRTNGLALTQVSMPRFDRSSRRAKRALDIAVSLVALIPIALLTPVIALAIRLDSPGGVIFRQRRIGRDGREFDILKFRTMTATAEEDRAALAEANEGAGPLFKLRHDPRVTRVGAVLRRFSIDELPQFWNVLRGDMSVVGPRPPLPDEIRAYDRDAIRRLFVQPGITGLWQISGRSDLSWDQSVRLDLHYVENWSILTDLTIILRTARAVLRSRGAY